MEQKNWSICQTNIHRNGNRRISNNIAPITCYIFPMTDAINIHSTSKLFPSSSLFSQTPSNTFPGSHPQRDSNFPGARNETSRFFLSFLKEEEEEEEKEGNEE